MFTIIWPIYPTANIFGFLQLIHTVMYISNLCEWGEYIHTCNVIQLYKVSITISDISSCQNVEYSTKAQYIK